MREINIYIDIHCLLDTTLEVASGISNRIKDDLDTYRKRVDNRFTGLMAESAFEARYEDMGKHISIRNCKATPHVFMLRKYIDDSKAANANGVEPITYKIVINTFPLVISSDDVGQLLDMVKALLNTKAVTTVSMPPSLVTPKYIERFNEMSIYDLDKWVKIHIYDLLDMPVPHVTITAPLIKKNDLKNLTVKEAVLKTEQFLAPFFSLNLVPLAVFSIDEIRK